MPDDREPFDLAAVTAPLFVPGDRPERFAKAAAAAEVAILDLEDAVAPEAKDAALRAVIDALTEGGLRALVRICAADDPHSYQQLTALRDLPGLLGVMIPKAEDPQTIGRVGDALGGLPIIALVETARGVLAADRIAAAKGVRRLAMGLLDLANDLSVATDSPVLEQARTAVVLGSRAGGLPSPWDSPTPEIKDTAAVAAAAAHARSWGFGGKLCIHPAQVPVVRTAFRPTDAELDWARRVVEAGEAAVQIDGAMVDRPVVERAKRLLAAARD